MLSLVQALAQALLVKLTQTPGGELAGGSPVEQACQAGNPLLDALIDKLVPRSRLDAISQVPAFRVHGLTFLAQLRCAIHEGMQCVFCQPAPLFLGARGTNQHLGHLGGLSMQGMLGISGHLLHAHQKGKHVGRQLARDSRHQNSELLSRSLPQHIQLFELFCSSVLTPKWAMP